VAKRNWQLVEMRPAASDAEILRTLARRIANEGWCSIATKHEDGTVTITEKAAFMAALETAANREEADRG
jgi:hypothetical protein